MPVTSQNISGNAATATKLSTDTGSAPSYACRAWVNFNGTGTVAIRASGNVSSITDNGMGNYTVNFTNAMPDANYSRSITASCDGYNTSALGDNGTLTYTTTAMQILLTGINGATNANFDASRVSVAIFR